MKVLLERDAAQESPSQIGCDQCGQQIGKNGLGYLDDHLSVTKTWGYGTSADGETHSFHLCFGCYSKMVEGFQIPLRVFVDGHLIK